MTTFAHVRIFPHEKALILITFFRGLMSHFTMETIKIKPRKTRRMRLSPRGITYAKPPALEIFTMKDIRQGLWL